MINRRVHGSFKPNGEIRQGDPLSPFFFILDANGLSRMLKVAKNERSTSGIKIARATRETRDWAKNLF